MDGAQHKCGVVEPPPHLLGGVGELEPADPEVQAIVDLVKSEFLKKSGVNAKAFQVVSYKSQVVAGRNYFVKVRLGKDQFCHLSIFAPIPYPKEKPQLKSFQLKKTEKDEITKF
ncbi:cystatin-A1-like [Rhinoderma darwinii]|uniref:cystatin-A1-like n=1 Tax=Rhinoderma darwinii TaxID=43563 RepID=UPI003F667FC2